MRRRWRHVPVVLAVALAAMALGALVLTSFQPSPPPAALALIEESTLIVLQGRAEIQQGAGAFQPVSRDAVVRVGDRVRTGPGSYAVVTYFDGSTTALEPSTEIILQRLERLADGGHQISFHQEIGLTWNRVERLVNLSSRFETTTAASVAFVRGTEYKVLVEASRRTTVEVVTDTVVVEAAGETVVVESGFQTIVEPAQPPAAPVPAPRPRFGVRLDLQGPVRLFLTDARNRSVGFQPESDTYISQIAGARYSEAGESGRLEIPEPAGAYEVVLKARGSGGSYTLEVTALVDGEPVAGRAVGLTRALAAERISGTITGGQLLGTRFVFRDGRVEDVRRPPVVVTGAPSGSRAAIPRPPERTPTPSPSSFVLFLPVTPTPQATVPVLATSTTLPDSPTPPAGPTPSAPPALAAVDVAPTTTPSVSLTPSPTPPAPLVTPAPATATFTPTPVPPSPTASPTDTASPTPTPGENFVQVCHRTNNPLRPFDLISVAESTLASHLGHGDVLPSAGSCPPPSTPTLRPSPTPTTTPTRTAEPAARITGRLVAGGASPVGGIRGIWLNVTCARSCAGSQLEPTAADGSFTVQGDRGIYTLWVAADRGHVSSSAVRVDARAGGSFAGVLVRANRTTSTVAGTVRAERDTGPGISGARLTVAIPVEGMGTDTVEVATARADAHGRYALSLAPGSYAFDVAAPSFRAAPTTRVTVEGPSVTQDFVLDRAGASVTIAGRLVSDGPARAGIPGVWLRATCVASFAACDWRQEASTGPDGSFTIRGAFGLYTIWADAESGYASLTGVRVDASTPSIQDVLVTARPASARVRGMVRTGSATGQTIANAQIEFLIPVTGLSGVTVPVASATSDADGAYSVQLAPGEYDARATVPGSTAEVRFRVTVPANELIRDIVVGAPRPVTITGRLVRADQLTVGIAGVRLEVVCRCTASQDGVTGADGSFTIRGGHDVYHLYAGWYSGYTSPAAIRVDASSRNTIAGMVVRAREATSVAQGTVRSGDEQGPGIAGANVRFNIPVEGQTGLVVPVAAAFTTASGTYRVERLAPGSYVAIADATGYQSSGRVTVPLTGAVTTQDFILQPATGPVTIRGRLVSASTGAAIGGVFLRVSCGQGLSCPQQVRSATDGSFVVYGSHALYTLWAAGDSGFSSAAAVRVDASTATEVEDVLVQASPAIARVVGTVRANASVGPPIRRAGVEFFIPVAGTASERVVVAAAEANASGQYELQVAPGAYPARAYVPSAQRPAPTTITIGGPLTTQDFVVQVGLLLAEIHGQLRTAGPNPVGIGGVILSEACTTIIGTGVCLPGQALPTASDGSFSLLGIFGVYTLWAAAPSGYTSTVAVRVDPRTAAWDPDTLDVVVTGVVVTASPATSVVSGTVRADGASGTGIPGASIEVLIPVDGATGETVAVALGTSTANGTYTVSLGPGTYSVRVQAAGFQALGPLELVVPASGITRDFVLQRTGPPPTPTVTPTAITSTATVTPTSAIGSTSTPTTTLSPSATPTASPTGVAGGTATPPPTPSSISPRKASGRA